MKYTKAQIGQWLSEWEGSGLSVSKYCQDKPFSKNALYYWDKKRKEKSKTEEVTNKFVPLQLLSPPESFAMSYEYLLPQWRTYRHSIRDKYITD